MKIDYFNLEKKINYKFKDKKLLIKSLTHKSYDKINNNEKYSGCTVHYVSAKLDSGKIIKQKKVKINKNDTPRLLKKKILIQEHKLYPEAILKIFNF